MEKPSEETIARLKQAHTDRALHLVEVQNPEDEEIFYFVMTGANSDEYKKFNDDVVAARDAKEADRNDKARAAAKSAILRQTLWPDREQVRDILHRNPGFVSQIVDKIHEHAGSSAEVRSKKL